MEEASSTLAYAENIRYLHSISIRTLEKTCKNVKKDVQTKGAK